MLFRNRWQTPQWGATALFFVSLSLRACSCGPKVLPFFLYLTFGSWVSARPRGEREKFRHRRLTNKKKIIVLNCQSSFIFLTKKATREAIFVQEVVRKCFACCFFVVSLCFCRWACREVLMYLFREEKTRMRFRASFVLWVHETTKRVVL